MKTLSNLVGCSTYLASDNESNRFNFHGLVECDDELIETLKGGTEVELKDVNPRILETFKDNDVNLGDYTHCIIGILFIMEMIRETIREAMRIRKVKSKDLAEHIGLSESSMSLFLNGKMNLGQNKIESILEYLNIELVIKKMTL